MFAANFIAGLIVNLLLNPIAVFIAIPIYCYVATAVHLALMYNKLKLGDSLAE